MRKKCSTPRAWSSRATALATGVVAVAAGAPMTVESGAGVGEAAGDVMMTVPQDEYGGLCPSEIRPLCVSEPHLGALSIVLDEYDR
jgi:hypothetical protein